MTPPGSTRRESQLGFSLLEVMIALVIAGLALGAVFRAAADGSRATSTAARYQEAISRARSHLDGTAAYLAAGEQEGDDGAGFHWRTAVRATDSTGKRDASGKILASEDALVVTLYAVTVWITWRDGATGRTVRLDTERLLTTAPVGHR
jgi:general secretion pathway protein I